MCSVVLKIVLFTSVENVNGFLVHIIMHKSNIVLRLQICLSGNAFDNFLLTPRCVARCMQVSNCGRYQVATQNVSWRIVSKTTNILSVQPINCFHSRGFCPVHCYTIVDFKLPPCYAFVFFVWMNPLGLKFMFRRFGTLFSLHNWHRLEGLQGSIFYIWLLSAIRQINSTGLQTVSCFTV